MNNQKKTMKTFLKKLIPFFAVTLAFVFQSCENKSKVQERKQTQKKVETVKISIPTDEITDEFYDAIFENNNQKVKQILETTFPANYEPKNKIPPLQAVIWAADNLYLAKLFVEGGAKINNEENPAVVVASE
jgi:cell division protein FtsI/penicillin-binding protein 2